MESFQLPRKKWPLALCCAACLALELALYFGVTRPALSAMRAGLGLEGEWSWVSIAGWHAAVALGCAALAWQPLAELRTKFTNEGVRRPRLFAPALFVGWDEAESVFVAPSLESPQHVKIKAPRGSVVINALFYKNPQRLLSLIEERMRAHTTSSAPACPARAADFETATTHK
ncbi:MAG TPA: hypothetical protein VF240_08875 [Pyrinomonadaceae bacterium]